MYYHRQVNRRPRGNHFSKDSFERTFCNTFNTKAVPEINQVTVIYTGKGCACCLQLWLHVAGLHWLFQQSSASPHTQCWPSGTCGGVSHFVQVREVTLTEMWALSQGPGLYKQPSQTCHITTLSSFSDLLSVRPRSWQHISPESSSPRSRLSHNCYFHSWRCGASVLSRAPAPGIQKYSYSKGTSYCVGRNFSAPNLWAMFWPLHPGPAQWSGCTWYPHSLWKIKTVSQQDILVPPQNSLTSAGLANKLLSSELSCDPQ